MTKPRSAWRSLGQGIMWGGFVAVLNAPIFLVLFIIAWNIDSLLHGLGFDPVVYGIDDILTVALYFGSRILAIPSIVGGGTLALILHFWALRYPQASRYGLWAGIPVGMVVASSRVFYSFVAFGRPDWILEALVCIAEAVIYTWVGWRLALSYQEAAQEAQSEHVMS